MKILVTDDHQIFRAAFINLLQAILQENSIYIEAKNGLEALALVKEQKFDVLFLDLSMPKMNGYETCTKILSLYENYPIIMLTQHSHPSVINFFNKLNVSFITKNANIKDIKNAIDAVLINECYLEPGLVGGCSSETGCPELGWQEKILLHKLKAGFSSKQIALQMNLTPRTIETYRERLLKRLKVKNIAELISFAFRTGNDQD